MRNSRILATFVAVSLLSACAQPGSRPGSGIMSGGNANKQDIGTLAGAIGGGIIGNNIGSGSGRVAATIAGTLLGGAIGNSIGGSLDSADRTAYHQASNRALETSPAGESLPWKNPRSGNYGTVTPSGYYKNSRGQYCREYTQTIVIGGKRQSGHGTACRERDGSWKIVE